MDMDDFITVPRIDSVRMKEGPRAKLTGALVLVRHHLIFSPTLSPVCESKKGHEDMEFWLLHRAVDRVTCDQMTSNGGSGGGLITLKCKNFLLIVFEIPSWEDAKAAASSILTLSNLGYVESEYPFFFRCPFQVLDNGWEAFTVENELARLMTRMGAENFRISSVNEGFSVCRSYPAKVIVPKGIGDDYLKISATFRDGGRFPVLSYYHKETKSSIFRCGQPLIGLTNRRCKEDETILNSLLTINKGIIIDTRAKSVAQSAKAKGGGHESQSSYHRWRYITCATPRLSQLREAFFKMVEVTSDPSLSSDKYVSRISSSGWLAAVADNLDAAANVAQCVHCEGTPEVPVVVHGGEGVDSTLMATSLAQIMLDSDARTIRGFEALIEREWMLGGHPFSLRNSRCAYADKPHEGPVFLCFLDCVHQIVAQYPHSFEFGEDFLIFLFEHACASEFGTFLGNSEDSRLACGMKKKTVSLWSYVNNPEILRTFVNDMYEPRMDVIWPSVAPQSIRIWQRLFFRWQKNWVEEDAIKKAAQQWKAKEKALTTKALILRRQLIELSKEAALSAAIERAQIK